MQFTIDRYPHLDNSLRELARKHGELQDEPLHLALLYDPGRETEDVFLFELLGNFGRNEIGEEGELFEVAFGPTDQLPLSAGQHLHLVLSSTREFEFALAQEWKSALEMRDAVRRGDFEILYKNEIGENALGWLR
jgi:hypothetical protein